MADRIALEAPLDAPFGPVVRVIVGGVAERADFGFEAMDDLQLAVERLLAEAGSDGQVALSFEIGDGRVRTRVGPLREAQLARALQEGQSAPTRPSRAPAAGESAPTPASRGLAAGESAPTPASRAPAGGDGAARLPTLSQVLDAVTSSYGVEATGSEGIVVRLEKLAEEPP